MEVSGSVGSGFLNSDCDGFIYVNWAGGDFSLKRMDCFSVVGDGTVIIILLPCIPFF